MNEPFVPFEIFAKAFTFLQVKELEREIKMIRRQERAFSDSVKRNIETERLKNKMKKQSLLNEIKQLKKKPEYR